MKPSDINADRWADGVISSSCTVDSEPVDPWTVQATEATPAGAVHHLTLRLAAEVVRFELGQSGIELRDAYALVEFARDDLRKQGAVARSGYLDFARAILKPRDRAGFFRRLFASEPKVPPAAWQWVSTEDVRRDGDVLVIAGKVIRAS